MARRRRKQAVKEKAEKAKRKELAEERDIVVLFADVVGCSEISNNLSIQDYNRFINTFQRCFTRVCDHYKKLEYEQHERTFFDCKVRGDEGCLKIFVPMAGESLAKDIDIAISIGLDLKRIWLFTDYNKKRIKDRLLPVDLGIGVHAGKVFVNEDRDNERKYRPEGYAINLAKRIESESRRGKFGHILVSESARGQLYSLKDECTYRFDMPFIISPKGISRDVKVFEIKHHFLPTDWVDVPSELAMICEELKLDNEHDKVKIAERAHENNPTNLWLAEEYLLLIMMKAYQKLREEGKQNDLEALKNAYAPALEIAQRIANSELRDSGLLGIWGFILGEQRNYKEEQRRYEEALALDDQDGDIHWYMALSISYQLSDAQEDKEDESKIREFYTAHKEKEIRRCRDEFIRALELRPMNPWIMYDYACELSWWSQAEKSFKKSAIDMLINAFALNSKTKEKARDEEYLEPIIDEERVKQQLQS